MAYTILIFNDHVNQPNSLSKIIRDKFGYQTVSADTVEYGIRWLISCSQPQPDLILIELLNGSDEVFNIIRQIKAYKPQLPIIIMAQYGNEDHAARAISAGANDFLTKPVSIERLKLSLQNALKIQHMSNTIARLERKNSEQVCFSDLVGESELFKSVVNAAEKAAVSDAPVWINGEQGTGRELMARAIHGSSHRAGKPFITINCDKLNNEQAETMLFGRAEIPGKSKAVTGKLQSAHQGTVYFYEINCMPSHLQQRIIEMIRERKITPLGSHNAIPVDVRIICSNSVNIETAMTKGAFSNVLYEKLHVSDITIPPLRARREDIALLAQYFLNQNAATENKFPAILAPDAIRLLEEHPWPGNARQLCNLLSRVVLLSQLDHVDAATIRLIQQLEPVNYASVNKQMPSGSQAYFDVKGQIKKLRLIEKEVIKLAIEDSGGCMTRAARNLGIGRSTLYRKIDEMFEPAARLV